jgi:pheromone shutdown-related protein TraB
MTEPPGPGSAAGTEVDGDGSIQLVGTAHVSQESVDEVKHTITEEQPDVVAVELDEGRYKQLKGEAPEDLDADDLIRGNTVFQFLAYWMLSYLQKRLGDRFDVTSGADMRAAIDTAESYGIGVALVDRDIQVTVQRFWTRLRAREKAVMVGGLLAELEDPRVVATSIGLGLGGVLSFGAEAIAGPMLLPAGSWAPTLLPAFPTVGGLLVGVTDFILLSLTVGLGIALPIGIILGRFGTDEDIEEFDIERLTDTDVVSAMMEEFRRFSPGGAEALIDERDAFIAHRLVALRQEGYDVVAVVGAGHRDGIESYLQAPDTLPPLDSLMGTESGRRFSLYKLIGYGMTVAFVAFFALLALAGASQQYLLELFAAWFIVNAIFAGGLALLAGARWTSATVAGSVAWLTSVNPLLAPGWFAGYVELRYQDVSVGDISTLNDILDDEEAPIRDIIARMRAVPLFQLILVVALTNIGSMVASLIVFPAILPWLAAPIGGPEAMGGELLKGARIGADILVEALS